MRAVAWVAALALAACDGGGDGGAGAVDTADAAVADTGAADVASATDADAGEDYQPGAAPLGDSGYSFTLELSEGPTYTLERDLTKEPGAFAFGSTHIAPAVSLAIQDQLLDPFLFLTLNFGFVVGSPEHPVTVDGPGTYTLGGDLPLVAVELPPQKFTSKAATGIKNTIEITDFSVEAGGLFAGTLSATLVDETNPQRYAILNGSFHFVLPPRDGGAFDGGG